MLTKVAQTRTRWAVDKWTCLRDAFVILTVVICRAHNIPAFTFVQVVESQLRTVLRRCKLSILSTAFLYSLHGSATFFLLGNSNAISSIDVSVGFAGVPFYCIPLHGLLILLYTCAGPIFWMLSLARITDEKWDKRWLLLFSTLFLLADSVFLLITLGNATLQRHHLFIWTVFAPKVLYKSVGSLISSISVMIALKLIPS